MKRTMTFLSCMVLVAYSYAQKPKVIIPSAAKAAFAAKFPAAQKTTWSVEKPGEFEVEYTLNKVKSSALYDAAGNLIETETEIKGSALPQDVKATISKDFSGYKLDEIEKATDAKGVTTYEMEAAKGKDRLELSFDAKGKLLSKEVMKKEAKD